MTRRVVVFVGALAVTIVGLALIAGPPTPVENSGVLNAPRTSVSGNELKPDPAVTPSVEPMARDEIVTRLVRAGWLESTAKAVVAFHAEWLDELCRHDRNGFEKTIALLEQLRDAGALTEPLTERPELVGLYLCVQDPVQLESSLRSVNAADRYVLASLFLAHLDRADADDLAIEIRISGLDKLRQEQVRMWVNQKRWIEESLDRLDLVKVAGDLSNCPVKEDLVPELREYRNGFADMVVSAAERHAKNDREVHRWGDCIPKLDAALKDGVVTRLTDRKAQDRLRALATELRNDQDRTLYDAFRKSPTRENANRYLKDAPFQTMKSVVESYVTWRDTLHTDHQLTLTAQVHWGTWANDKDTQVQVWVKRVGADDDQRLCVLDTTIRSAENESSDPLRSDEFHWTPSQEVEVSVQVNRTGNPNSFVFSKRLSGTTADTKMAKDFVQGLSEETQKLQGTDRGTRVQVKFNGVPNQPLLGEWKAGP